MDYNDLEKWDVVLSKLDSKELESIVMLAVSELCLRSELNQ